MLDETQMLDDFILTLWNLFFDNYEISFGLRPEDVCYAPESPCPTRRRSHLEPGQQEIESSRTFVNLLNPSTHFLYYITEKKFENTSTMPIGQCPCMHRCIYLSRFYYLLSTHAMSRGLKSLSSYVSLCPYCWWRVGGRRGLYNLNTDDECCLCLVFNRWSLPSQPSPPRCTSRHRCTVYNENSDSRWC